MNNLYFLDVADYNNWVSSKAIDWLTQLSNEQWEQVIISSFGSIRQTTLHIVSAEKIWVDFWKNTPDPLFLSTTFRGTNEELLAIWRQSSAELKQFIDTYPEENYQQPVAFSWRGKAWRMEFWQTVAHFVNHATYHRGQLVTLLRQAGFSGLSSTDLATYYYERQQDV